MRGLIHMAGFLVMVALGSARADAADAPVKPADVLWGNWQHHVMTINYFGITSLYSCDSLEDRVREILLLLGARKDAKVTATGCPGGPEVPSHTAWIKTDFYALAPTDSQATPGTVRAHWVLREINPRHPSTMGSGDCELMEQMKELISKSFTLRDARYDTDCVPHQTSIDSFDFKGQVPIAEPEPSVDR